VADGPTSEVTAQYLGRGIEAADRREWTDPARAPGNDLVRLRGVRVCTDRHGGTPSPTVDIRQPIGIEVEFEILAPGHILVPAVQLTNEYGGIVCMVADQSAESRDRPREPGRYRSTAWLPGNFFAEGTLLVSVSLRSHSPDRVHCQANEAVALQIVDSPDGDSARGHFAGNWPGAVRPLVPWSTTFVPAGDGLADGGSG
jgi:lipopolysaccharide transport system ATP-binding protein